MTAVSNTRAAGERFCTCRTTDIWKQCDKNVKAKSAKSKRSRSFGNGFLSSRHTSREENTEYVVPAQEDRVKKHRTSTGGLICVRLDVCRDSSPKTWEQRKKDIRQHNTHDFQWQQYRHTLCRAQPDSSPQKAKATESTPAFGASPSITGNNLCHRPIGPLSRLGPTQPIKVLVLNI